MTAQQAADILYYLKALCAFVAVAVGIEVAAAILIARWLRR